MHFVPVRRSIHADIKGRYISSLPGHETAISFTHPSARLPSRPAPPELSNLTAKEYFLWLFRISAWRWPKAITTIRKSLSCKPAMPRLCQCTKRQNRTSGLYYFSGLSSCESCDGARASDTPITAVCVQSCRRVGCHVDPSPTLPQFRGAPPCRTAVVPEGSLTVASAPLN
jgi:hypothetical protein